MRLAEDSAPESRRADVFLVPSGQSRIMGRQVRLLGGGYDRELRPLVLLAPLMGVPFYWTVRGLNALLPRSIGMIESSPVYLSPPSSVGNDPPSSPPAHLRN